MPFSERQRRLLRHMDFVPWVLRSDLIALDTETSLQPAVADTTQPVHEDASDSLAAIEPIPLQILIEASLPGQSAPDSEDARLLARMLAAIGLEPQRVPQKLVDKIFEDASSRSERELRVPLESSSEQWRPEPILHPDGTRLWTLPHPSLVRADPALRSAAWAVLQGLGRDLGTLSG